MEQLRLDMFRAGLRHKKPGTASNSHKILMYVMAHTGNNPSSWRRQLFNDIGHGLKILDLYQFRTHFENTENYVDPGNGMYKEVLTTLYELGSWEDIVQSGHAHAGGARVGLYFSRAADVWADTMTTPPLSKTVPTPAFSAHKKAMYIMLRHLGLMVDVIVEADLSDGTVSQYDLLLVTDRHVSRNASQNIVNWVNAGGTVVASAGGGMRDEFDEENTQMSGLFGVRELSLELDDPSVPIALLKQDLPHAVPLDTVAAGHHVNGAVEGVTLQASAPMPVFGAVSRVAVVDNQTAQIAMSFPNGSVAMTKREAVGGHAIYMGFLLGLSYFKPALPKR
jgi:hypothetical protein